MGRGGEDRLSCSFVIIIIIISFTLSPFASKVLRQDGDHSLQRSQHRSVDHHWPVQLAVTAEMRRKMEVIDKSIIAAKAKAATESALRVSAHSSESCDSINQRQNSGLFLQALKLTEVKPKGNHTMCPEGI